MSHDKGKIDKGTDKIQYRYRDGAELDEEYTEEFFAATKSFPGSVFVNNCARIINDTKEDKPDGFNLEIKRPDLSTNASNQPLARRKALSSREL